MPDRFTLPLAALGLGINTFNIYTSPNSAIWGYLIGFLCLWIVYYLFKVITGKEGMGYGDFKLLATLGAWMGSDAAVNCVIVIVTWRNHWHHFIKIKK